MKRFKILIMLLCVLVISSCGLNNLKPIDQASVVSKEATTTYMTLYDTYKSLEAVLTGSQLSTLKEAAPLLNEAKRVLISYNDLVIQWRESGGDEPINLLVNKELLNSLMSKVSTILINLM